MNSEISMLLCQWSLYLWRIDNANIWLINLSGLSSKPIISLSAISKLSISTLVINLWWISLLVAHCLRRYFRILIDIGMNDRCMTPRLQHVICFAFWDILRNHLLMIRCYYNMNYFYIYNHLMLATVWSSPSFLDRILFTSSKVVLFSPKGALHLLILQLRNLNIDGLTGVLSF